MKLTKRKRVHFNLEDIKAHIMQNQPSPAPKPTHFDLSVDPYTYKDLATSFPFSPSVLSQPATQFPVSKIRVVIHPLPSVYLTVHVESGAYISVGHLLRCLHHALEARVSEEEWAQLGEWEQAVISKAFYGRCEASADYYGTLYNGVKRIDLLCGETAFQGIEPSTKWANAWDLILRKRRRPAPPPPTRRPSYFSRWVGA